MAFLDYAPAPESTSILNLRDEYRLWIGGEWVTGGGTAFASISPSTERQIAMFASADEGDVDAAVAAARTARSTSAAVPVATSVSTSSVAGLTVLNGSPVPSKNWPSMNRP